ncbi:MAG: peptidoglycan-binding protein [Clostridia bacterium]|nr:peptidoglycan-binding protein [Clostridia bacterium]
MFRVATKELIDKLKYIHWNELYCHCEGKYCKPHEIPYSYELALLLEDFRKYFGKPLIITSPTRCVKWNELAGGVKRSKHTYYKEGSKYVLGTTATDFYIKGVTYKKLESYAKKIKKKYNVSYYYNVKSSIMHIDINAPEYVEKYNLTRILKKGCKGSDVKELQKELGIKADGIFGDKTKQAVKAFQNKHKITADGIVGKNTAHALGWLWKGK